LREKRKKKESALSLLLILSLLVYTRESPFFSPAVFKKRKMERRGSTQRLDDEMFLKEKKGAMVALFSSLSCLLGTVLLCVGTSVLEFSLRLLHAARELKKKNIILPQPVDLFYFSFPWICRDAGRPGLDLSFKRLFIYFGQLLLLLFLEQIRHFSGV
jgi:hypothetical protein